MSRTCEAAATKTKAVSGGSRCRSTGAPGPEKYGLCSLQCGASELPSPSWRCQGFEPGTASKEHSWAPVSSGNTRQGALSGGMKPTRIYLLHWGACIPGSLGRKMLRREPRSSAPQAHVPPLSRALPWGRHASEGLHFGLSNHRRELRPASTEDPAQWGDLQPLRKVEQGPRGSSGSQQRGAQAPSSQRGSGAYHGLSPPRF